MDCIGEYVRNIECRVPIFTNDIYRYALMRFPELRKNVLNEYVTRYAKRHSEFIRYKKGICYTELIKRVYLLNGNEVCGYETGPSFMNKIGLITQMPAYTYLATERVRTTIAVEDDRLFLLKPVTKVTKDNYRYLQFLDLLDNRMKIKFDAKNYKEILRNYIDTYRLNFETLLSYARLYKNNKLFIGIAELARVEVLI